MNCFIKNIDDTHLMLCLSSGDTQVVRKDSAEAKFWLQKLKEQE